MKTGQVNLDHFKSSQDRESQVRTGQVRTGQVGTGPLRPVQVGTGKVGIGQPQTTQVLCWDCTKIKMKTYTWNSSVALLSPTCLINWQCVFQKMCTFFLINACLHIVKKHWYEQLFKKL